MAQPESESAEPADVSDRAEQESTESFTLSLRSITRGASFSIGGKLLSNVFGLLTNLLLTRGLGAGLFGVYTYGHTILSIFSIFANLGTGKSVLRFVPEYEDTGALQNAVLGLAYLTALGASVLTGAALFFTAPLITQYTLGTPLLTDVLRVFAVVLPFNTLSNLTNSVFRSLEQIRYQVFIGNVVSPAVRLLSIGGALLVGFSIVGVVAASAVGGILVLATGLTILARRTELTPSLAGSRAQTADFYRFSLPLTFKDVGSYLYNRVDILMVGFFLAGSSVGIYKVAVVVSSLLVIPLNAFNQLFPPVASRLYSNDEMGELESVYGIVTRWTFTVAIVPALGAILYRNELLSVFGSEFSVGGTVLILFTVAQLTNCAVGPSGYVLMMTDHQYLNLANQWLLGILNVGLNYLFIREFGFIGAAMATAGVLAAINVLRVCQVWYTERLFPYSRQFWKPIGAGIAAAIGMAGWKIVLSGYPLLVAGGATGFLTFAGFLYLFGINSKDREFFEGEIQRLSR